LRPIAPKFRFSVRQADAAEFPVRVHGNIGGPRLILSHGNGFAIDGYWPFWRHLCDRYEVVVFDFRNHGQSRTGTAEGHDWPTFTRDFDRILKACEDELGSKPTAGLFHSMSSVTSVLHWRETAFPWASLVLFEPPILPPDDHPLHDDTYRGEVAIRVWALARQSEFASPVALADDLRRKRAFDGWEDDTYLLMAESILVFTPETGTWRLCCPPALEAKIYNENRHAYVWHDLKRMPFPVLIYSGDPARASGAITAKVSRALAQENGKDLHVQRSALHFPMLQDSRGAAEVVKVFLERAGVTAAC
jgi:pimeloyl-ACP methyl ester carboxylesterase